HGLPRPLPRPLPRDRPVASTQVSPTLEGVFAGERRGTGHHGRTVGPSERALTTPVTHPAFGLTRAPPLPFPPLPQADRAGEPAVVVVEGDVPRPGPTAEWAGPLRAVEEGSVIFDLPGAARLRISRGCRIEVERLPGGTEEALRLLVT